MKAILIVLVSIICLKVNAQSIEVSVSSDSILLGNSFKVTFTIKNIDEEIETPDFGEMLVVGGPNYSSSVQIVNGNRSSNKSITYYLKPQKTGKQFIPPCFIYSNELVLETSAIEINVYPNPDGIITEVENQNNHIFESFEFPFPSLEDFIEKKPKEKSEMEPVIKGSKSKEKVRKI